ncbi:C6 transcription factor [Penicillium atrosanguineum]|uniref:C6 transcription factor n=1 Tax=Penicillium atrosanguineum TaxID=1132637 RepID=A0A9W9Q0A4_9EURO|nr:C6 transcription factor [Penicillium atrosanguineum]
MSTSRFRPIQPHTSTTKAWAVGKAEEDVLKDAATRKLSTACKECQRRRIKCSSGHPCFECTKRDFVCKFDESSDKRRKGYPSKMEEELNYYQRFLNDFFEAIRSSDDDVHHIINAVRSGSSASAIQFEVNIILAGNNST